MNKAMIFDLDGTLVQTERLKALSYARAAVELCPQQLNQDDVVEAFKEVVGLSRREVATALVERFGLAQKAKERMSEFGVSAPWQAYVQVRLKIYAEIIADPQVIRANQWAHNMALLKLARQTNCKVGLATMSYCEQASRILQILELNDAFDFVATRDDVEHSKPDPEIYTLVAKELDRSPAECLVVEDSPAGVSAALNAGMHVVAVSTPFTRKGLHELSGLPSAHIVDQPSELLKVVAHILEHINQK